MKRIILSALIAALLTSTCLSFKTAYALGDTIVTGTVKQKNGNVAPGASVSVLCNHITRYGNADANGVYSISYTDVECPLNSIINVYAAHGNNSGGTSGVVTPIKKFNITLVNVSIPEFGWLGGVIDTGVGIGAIVIARRHFTRQAST